MHQDFPIEPFNNSVVLKPTFGKLKIRYGASQWGRTEWIGRVYPPGLKEPRFLEEYVKHFNSIELNATHYKFYTPQEVGIWTKKSEGKDFIFCPKVTQSISHYSSFVDIEDKTTEFLNSVYEFGKHLGPIFLQVSDRFSPKRRTALFHYLTSLPTDLQWFLEVRNPEWFEEDMYEELLFFLRRNNIGLVISDSPRVGDCPKSPLRLDLTVAKCFIRYYPSIDYSRLDRWYAKIKEWESKGLKEAYFFINNNKDANRQLDELLYFKSLVERE